MRLWLLSLIAFAGAPAFADPDVPLEPSREACTFKLDGHVVDAKSHEPIAGATIVVDTDADAAANNPSNAGASALCDGDGHFVMENLCPGLLVLSVERDDYKKSERRLVIPGDKSVEVQLDALDEEVVEIHDKAPDATDTRSTTTLSGAALEKTRGKGLAEAIAEVPGVGELKSASGVGKPIIRGQFGRRLLLLVDGVRHRAQEWGLDHAPEIDPFVADKLTVVRGASGVRYGPDAIGGAVLVDPPELLREPGTAEGEAHLIGMTNGMGGSVAARLKQAPMVLPGFAYNVDGSYRRLAAAETPDYALENTGVEEWSAGATVGYRRKNAAYQLSFRHYQARIGVCACLHVESRDDFYAQIMRDKPIGYELFESDLQIDRPYQRVAHELAIGRASWDVPNGTLGATYSFQFDHRKEYDVVRESVMGPQYNFELGTHEIDVSFAHDPLHLNDHWHLRGQIGVVGMMQTHTYSGLQLVPDHRGSGIGAYAIERLVGHTVELEGGLRYDLTKRVAEIADIDYTRLVRSGQLAMDACDQSGDTFDCASTFKTLSASVGGVYRWSEEVATKLDLSTASRPPNPDEQYLNGTSPTFPVMGLGKPDLGPETTYSASVTTSVTHERITAEASAYANLIDDYIYFAPALDDNGDPIFDVLIKGTFPRFVTRPVNAVFYGADGGVTVRPIDELELSTQLSWIRAKNRTDNGYLVFVPPLQVRGELTYKPPAFAGLHDAFVSVNSTFVGKQHRFDLAADFAPPPDAYLLLGAEAGASFNAGDQTVKVALAGQNLTNARYRDYTSLLRYFADQPGWQLVLRASVSFSSK